MEQDSPPTNPRLVWIYTRRILGITLTVGAAALVWFALVAPNRINELTPSAFARIPIEGLALCALCLVVPVRVRRVVAIFAGFLLGVLIIVNSPGHGLLRGAGPARQPGHRLVELRTGDRCIP